MSQPVAAVTVLDERVGTQPETAVQYYQRDYKNFFKTIVSQAHTPAHAVEVAGYGTVPVLKIEDLQQLLPVPDLTDRQTMYNYITQQGDQIDTLKLKCIDGRCQEWGKKENIVTMPLPGLGILLNESELQALLKELVDFLQNHNHITRIELEPHEACGAAALYLKTRRNVFDPAGFEVNSAAEEFGVILVDKLKFACQAAGLDSVHIELNPILKVEKMYFCSEYHPEWMAIVRRDLVAHKIEASDRILNMNRLMQVINLPSFGIADVVSPEVTAVNAVLAYSIATGGHGLGKYIDTEHPFLILVEILDQHDMQHLQSVVKAIVEHLPNKEQDLERVKICAIEI